MKQYIGTKIIQAAPALRLDDGKGDVRIELLENNPLPRPGDSVDMGYKVVYEDGYESWSPLDVFDRAYRQTDGMSFGLAIEAAKMGKRIARKGWNGKNQYVQLATCISYVTHDGGLINAHHDAIGNKALAFVGTSGVQMGWLASQADMLADDWRIVEQEQDTRPTITVSGYTHNMQGWYQEKLTIAMNALEDLGKVLHCPAHERKNHWNDPQEYIEDCLSSAIAYVQTVLKVSTGG